MTRAKRSLTVLAGASLILAGACTDPAAVNNPDDPNRRAKRGAVLGGLFGAIGGALASDDKAKGALGGAVVGAGAGALIGNALDKQEAQLRRELGDDRVEIRNTGDRLIVTMPQDILFATDSFAVRPDLRDDLRVVAQSLRDYPDSTVQVIGHTDNTGEAAYNQRLSERRANAVADLLMEGGVAFGRIDAFGRGEDQPVASNLTPEGRARNRRVEIVILPEQRSAG
ncbi:OmpA family protein [Roseovarius salinarum]|uniref:OmpA family protein n=1 Tax=Roseovarius salinarum TaxID=1981892 RepID=UPI000C34F321|nr:OmpA family protein [Roseovarius salinarum]